MTNRTAGAVSLETLLLPNSHTPASVAAALGVSAQTVRYWMAGVMRPRARYRSKLQRLLGIPSAAWERLAPAHPRAA